MPITPPLAISPAPLPAPQRGQKATFSARLDRFVTWVIAAVDQFSAMADNVYANAQLVYTYATNAVAAAADAASSAAAAASASASVKWVSGTTYADGTSVWSPINRLPYRRVGAGSGTLDPSVDAAHWVIQLAGTGLGGITLTGSIALTSTSPGAILVTPSSPGLYATLPDATSCIVSAFRTGIYNGGDYDYGVRDFSGMQLGWIRARSGAVIGLVDNSTTAGIWTHTGLEKLGVTASITLPSVNSDGGIFARVALDSSRTMLLFGQGTSGVYAAVHDAVSSSWGSATLIRSSSSPGMKVQAILSSANQVLVVSEETGYLEAVTLTTSGVGVTVNSGGKATATITTLAANGLGQLISVGASFAVAYSYGSGAAVRAASISGTTVTLGAATAIHTGSPTDAGVPRIFAAGSVLRVFSLDTVANLLRANPFTLSGVTLAAGVSATVAAAGIKELRAFANGNGNIVMVYGDVVLSSPRGALAKLTGTTESLSVAVLSAGAGYGPTNVDVIAITASKTLIVWGNVGARANILTDSSGIASAGSELVLSGLPTPTETAAAALLGTVARFLLRSGSAAAWQLALDCSGASPTLQNCMSLNPLAAGYPQSSHLNVRPYQKLVAGDNVFAIDGGKAWDSCCNQTDARLLKPTNFVANAGAAGAANETWLLSSLPQMGTFIRRVEAAQ